MKQFLRYIKDKKFIIFLIILTTTFEIFATTITPKIFSRIIDEGILVKNIHIIKKDGVFLLSMSFISVFINIFSAYLITKLGFSFTDFLTKEIFSKIQGYSFENIRKIDPSSIITRITLDTAKVSEVFTGALRSLLIFPFTFAFAIYFAFQISKKLTITSLLIIPFLVLFVVFVGRKLTKIYKKLNKEIDKMNLIVKENIKGIKDIKSYTLEEKEIKKFSDSNKKIKKYSINRVRAIIIASPIINLIVQVIVAYILWLGLIEIKSGALETGQLIAFIMYMGQVTGALIMSAELLRQLYSAKVSYKRIDEILSNENIEKNDNLDKIDLDKNKLDITLENVSVKSEENYILKNININIPFGTTVGIIGNTGSAKTSLVNVIARVLKETEGKMLLGGEDINLYNEEEYLKIISYIPQKLVMFSGTIKDNIKMGNNEISDKDIVKALKTAEAYGFVSEYEDGIMHEVLQSGTNFSGGQRQRLNIARGLARNPKILILDDSISAIDINTEKKIWENMLTEMKDITRIIISQRISSIKNADQIIVMDEGRISNIGTHEELLEKDNIYKSIYEIQN